MKTTIKTYNLYLDTKNQRVLLKKLYNQTMNNKELKRLYRTIRVVERANVNVIKNQARQNKNLFW